MKAIKIIGIILLAFGVIGGIAVFTQPARGHVEKSIVIDAPPAAVFKVVNSFKSFNKWSPWAKMDLDTKYTFEGPESGVGAKLSWESRKVAVGKGSQWIEASVENEKVKIGLAFEGNDSKEHAVFILAPMGGGTTLTWTFDGENVGVKGKTMWLLMNVMLNDVYEQGIMDLKGYIESIPGDSTERKISLTK